MGDIDILIWSKNTMIITIIDYAVSMVKTVYTCMKLYTMYLNTVILDMISASNFKKPGLMAGT